MPIKGNPHHKKSGVGGGEFTSPTGEGGSIDSAIKRYQKSKAGANKPKDKNGQSAPTGRMVGKMQSARQKDKQKQAHLRAIHGGEHVEEQGGFEPKNSSLNIKDNPKISIGGAGSGKGVAKFDKVNAGQGKSGPVANPFNKRQEGGKGLSQLDAERGAQEADRLSVRRNNAMALKAHNRQAKQQADNMNKIPGATGAKIVFAPNGQKVLVPGKKSGNQLADEVGKQGGWFKNVDGNSRITPAANGEFDVHYGPGDTKHFRSMADLQRRHGLRNGDVNVGSAPGAESEANGMARVIKQAVEHNNANADKAVSAARKAAGVTAPSVKSMTQGADGIKHWERHKDEYMKNNRFDAKLFVQHLQNMGITDDHAINEAVAHAAMHAWDKPAKKKK